MSKQIKSPESQESIESKLSSAMESGIGYFYSEFILLFRSSEKDTDSQNLLKEITAKLLVEGCFTNISQAIYDSNNSSPSYRPFNEFYAKILQEIITKNVPKYLKSIIIDIGQLKGTNYGNFLSWYSIHYPNCAQESFANLSKQNGQNSSNTTDIIFSLIKKDHYDLASILLDFFDDELDFTRKISPKSLEQKDDNSNDNNSSDSSANGVSILEYLVLKTAKYFGKYSYEFPDNQWEIDGDISAFNLIEKISTSLKTQKSFYEDQAEYGDYFNESVGKSYHRACLTGQWEIVEKMEEIFGRLGFVEQLKHAFGNFEDDKHHYYSNFTYENYKEKVTKLVDDPILLSEEEWKIGREKIKNAYFMNEINDMNNMNFSNVYIQNSNVTQPSNINPIINNI